MESFQHFALSILQGLGSPIVVLNERLEIVSANRAGWDLIGGASPVVRGKPLEQFLVPTRSAVRTPTSVRQTYNPEAGWRFVLDPAENGFPRVTVRSPTDPHPEHERTFNISVAVIPGKEVLHLGRVVAKSNPEWFDDSIAPEALAQLVTQTNCALLFQDVTELAMCEVHRQESMRKTLDVVVRTLDHYIRNALTPILGYSDLVRRRGGTLGREELDRIMNRVGRHVHVITALLDALRTVRDIHIEEPLGADIQLIDIERELQRRLAELCTGNGINQSQTAESNSAPAGTDADPERDTANSDPTSKPDPRADAAILGFAEIDGEEAGKIAEVLSGVSPRKSGKNIVTPPPATTDDDPSASRAENRIPDDPRPLPTQRKDTPPMDKKKAPEFALPDQEGTIHTLADYKGRYVVLYWYPKDDTPGCTKQACGFRDTAAQYETLGVVVLGASILDAKSKKKFADKWALSFPLLADADHKVAEAYGVWKEKTRSGKTSMGIQRETFVIDPDGNIAKHWPDAKGSEDHAGEVLDWLRTNLA